jgi:hypothetical protein
MARRAVTDGAFDPLVSAGLGAGEMLDLAKGPRS